MAGASGYIGRAVVAELIERGYFVYVIVRQNTKFAQSNASNLNVLLVDIDKKEEWTQQFPKASRVSADCPATVAASHAQRPVIFLHFPAGCLQLLRTIQAKTQFVA